jgi:hypothetical protein
MEHIDCNTWIVMLRFTVVPLTGFEAFGVVSAERGGAPMGRAATRSRTGRHVTALSD